jgi:nitrogen-specific signal transduction histidine kinase
MKIQFNTDKNISGDERSDQHFTSLILKSLDRFQSLVTRVEVHLSDENAGKNGINEIKCILEARIEGKQPIAVSSQAGTIESAFSTALDKMKSSLETIVGRMQDH